MEREKVLPGEDDVNNFRSPGCINMFTCPDIDSDNCSKDGDLHLCHTCPVADEMANIFFKWLKERRNFMRTQMVGGVPKDEHMILANNNDAFEVINGRVYESTSATG